MRGMTKKNCQGHWYSAFPSIIPSTCIHSNVLNTFILKPLQSLIFHIPMVSCHPRNRLLLPANVFDCPQILRKPKHFHLGFFRDKLGSKSWWFVWCSTGVRCSPKKWSQIYMLLGMAREFWESFPQCPFMFSKWISTISPSKTEMKNHGT